MVAEESPSLKRYLPGATPLPTMRCGFMQAAPLLEFRDDDVEAVTRWNEWRRDLARKPERKTQ